VNFVNFTWMILLPLAGAPLIYLLGRIGILRWPGTLGPGLARWVCAAILLAAGVVFVQSALTFNQTSIQTFTLGAVNLRLDGLALLISGLALVLGFLVAIFSGPYLAGEDDQEKYYALLALLVGSISGLACAADLFNLWVWFEAMALSTYVLVAFYEARPESLEAGVKYLVQSAVGSALVVFAIAAVFAATGVLDLERIHTVARSSPLLLGAGALFMVGFGVKAALVPLHTWLPDAHSQAPSGISALLSGVVIEAGLIAMLRALGALMGVSLIWGPLLLVFGAANMLFGNLMALRQNQVKRLLAYSSLAHVGYMLLGLGVSMTFGLANGAEGAFFHLLNHGLMKALAFLSAGALLYALYIAHDEHRPLTVEDLAGAARRYPLPTFALSVAVLGLGGLPPLAGFMSKWQIFVAGFQTHDIRIYALVIFAALNSLLSLGYYAPIVNRMYRHKASPRVLEGDPLPAIMAIPLVLLALAVIVLGILPNLATWLTAPAAGSLLAVLGGGG